MVKKKCFKSRDGDTLKEFLFRRGVVPRMVCLTGILICLNVFNKNNA